MKVNRKTVLTITIVTLLLCVAFVAGFTVKQYVTHRNPGINANVEFYEGSGADAKLFAVSGNLITDIGENVTLFSLLNANQTLVAISTGNCSSITADLTQLDVEASGSGFERVVASVSAYWFNDGDISVNFTATFSASAMIAVNSVGLHWSSVGESDENMYAASFITDGTYHQFPFSDPVSELTVKWVITINAN